MPELRTLFLTADFAEADLGVCWVDNGMSDRCGSSGGVYVTRIGVLLRSGRLCGNGGGFLGSGGVASSSVRADCCGDDT